MLTYTGHCLYCQTQLTCVNCEKIVRYHTPDFSKSSRLNVDPAWTNMSRQYQKQSNIFRMCCMHLLVIFEIHDTVRLYSTQLCATGVIDSCSSVVGVLDPKLQRVTHCLPALLTAWVYTRHSLCEVLLSSVTACVINWTGKVTMQYSSGVSCVAANPMKCCIQSIARRLPAHMLLFTTTESHLL